jgi:transcriptional regulator with XRE-family HTH domain
VDLNVIRVERERRSLSVREVSNAAGLSASTTSRIERGLIDPSLSTMERILAAIGMRLVIVPSDEEACP